MIGMPKKREKEHAPAAELEAVRQPFQHVWCALRRPKSGRLCRPALDGDDESAIHAALARRIYKTRNSIVHSKEGARRKYVPFEHDRVLVKEVPLVRFVAELIITTSSSQIS